MQTDSYMGFWPRTIEPDSGDGDVYSEYGGVGGPTGERKMTECKMEITDIVEVDKVYYYTPAHPK